MLYYLHSWAGEGWSFLALFGPVAFRAALAAVFAFVLCVAAGRPFIAWLRRRKIEEDVGKKDSQFLIEKHALKKHTPTMGGVVLVGSALLATALFARPDVPFVPLAIFSALAMAAVGFYDDWIKLNRKGQKGLSIRGKLFFQFLVGGIAGAVLLHYGDAENASTVAVPFVGRALWPVLGYGYVAWAALVFTGSTNAVNLTDGLDGLATLCTLTAAAVFGLLAYLAGSAGLSSSLGVPGVAGAGELCVVCAALFGACLGFLWFNAHPAEVFMGDTGSLPLGSLLGLVALSIRQELLLVLVGGVFVAEALSVLIQIFSFRCFGRRVFLIAPLHHHLEKAGWSETKIVSRFFIVSVLLAVCGVATLRL